jgi:hypothetical protein
LVQELKNQVGMETVFKVLALVGLLSAFSSTPSAAWEGSGQEGADRWVPSVALISGVTFQDWDGGVSSSICRGCMIPDPMEEQLRPGATGGDLDVSPSFGTGVELMTPEIPIPGSPRLFFGAEIAGVFGANRKPAQNGETGKVGNPAPEQAQDSTGFGDDIALGQGSEVLAKIEDTSYGATLGIAFPFELYGRAFRIKPAFSWIRYEVAIDGLVVDAECSPIRGTAVTECNTTPPQNGFLRETRLGASRTVTFDGIGPSLDIEMETGRLGPLGTSLFLGARFYRTVGGRKVKFDSEIETFDDVLSAPGQDQSQAHFNFEVDKWMYRIGVGLRFQWLGSKK